MTTAYSALAKKIFARARRRGASQSEVFFQTSKDAHCRVRDGVIEDLTEATAKGVGIRVFVGSRLGFCYSSDFTESVLLDAVDRACSLAQKTTVNRLNGLPEGPRKRIPDSGLTLFDDGVASIDPQWKMKAAVEAERAARSYDPRIRTMESVGAGDNVHEVFLASSDGFSGGYQGTNVYVYAVPVAEERGQLQTSYWMDTKRFLSELESPESVGTEAARRAIRMLGARKVKSQRVPVIFDPMMAASFVSTLASAANGDSVYKKSSILGERLGQSIASTAITVVDDGTLPKGLASAPFDGEGVPVGRTPIIERGFLRHFLYDTFTARKAKTRTTGNAARSYKSLPHIGTHNIYLAPGLQSPESIISDVKTGLYVTAMLGSGVNIVTGDYSRGANGVWIERGEFAQPVQEVTVAGNLIDMLKNLDAVGNDLSFRGSVGAPTIRFSEMTVSGE